MSETTKPINGCGDESGKLVHGDHVRFKQVGGANCLKIDDKREIRCYRGDKNDMILLYINDGKESPIRLTMEAVEATARLLCYELCHLPNCADAPPLI